MASIDITDDLYDAVLSPRTVTARQLVEEKVDLVAVKFAVGEPWWRVQHVEDFTNIIGDVKMVYVDYVDDDGYMVTQFLLPNNKIMAAMAT